MAQVFAGPISAMSSTTTGSYRTCALCEHQCLGSLIFHPALGGAAPSFPPRLFVGKALGLGARGA